MTRNLLTLAVALAMVAAAATAARAEDPAAKIGGAFKEGYVGLREGVLGAYETTRKGTVEKWHDVTGKSGQATEGPGSAMTAEVQRELITAGYTPGPIDGRYGPMTGNAIRAYQGDNGLAQDGQISQALLTHLQAKRAAATGGQVAPAPTAPVATSGQAAPSQSLPALPSPGASSPPKPPAS